ncbi:MAG: tRNA epoxyqueuosine(34) reductase QueG [Rhizobiales bacterium]|nr:tRNA epoxyqueuosine(34) reductase QueG [Hyphomicrobiales bacterium]NRB14250.1 tRNA epoxyqueuosine(34) reductase QueG [Hyphomicrobiales bacterium]
MDNELTEIADRITSEALALGFDVVGFTQPDKINYAGAHLKQFVAQDLYGEMGWMSDTLERRSQPNNLWQEVKTVIMLGMNYGPEQNPLELLENKDSAVISVYAQGHDYHELIKKKLKHLARFMVGELPKQFAIEDDIDVKVFVDTAPVMEKPLAGAAGLGWQGKHTNLVSKQFGSWLFLGSIFTTLKLPQSQPEPDNCGTCTACLDICPTNAFIQSRQIDARKCISYLTIEYGGHIERELRPKMGNRIYGCDDCLAACPWNKFAQLSSEAKFHARTELKAPELTDLVMLNDPDFRTLFTASPVKRIKRRRFIRNVLIAIGNSQNPKYLPQITALLVDEEPLIRGAAIWAAEQLSGADEFSALYHQYAGDEIDDSVKAEWDASLQAFSGNALSGAKA